MLATHLCFEAWVTKQSMLYKFWIAILQSAINHITMDDGYDGIIKSFNVE